MSQARQRALAQVATDTRLKTGKLLQPVAAIPAARGVPCDRPVSIHDVGPERDDTPVDMRFTRCDVLAHNSGTHCQGLIRMEQHRDDSPRR